MNYIQGKIREEIRMESMESYVELTSQASSGLAEDHWGNVNVIVRYRIEMVKNKCDIQFD